MLRKADTVWKEDTERNKTGGETLISSQSDTVASPRHLEANDTYSQEAGETWEDRYPVPMRKMNETIQQEQSLMKLL